MDRIVFGKKTSSGQRRRVDRFVASRYYFEEMRRLWGARNEQTVDIWYAKNRQQKKYTRYLDEVFGLEPIKSQESSGDTPDDRVQTWPCIPRKNRYLSSADSILDLPTFGYAIFPELLDWSNDNILVAALGDSYHKWSWRTQSLISQGYAACTIQCCKFDPRGQLLVLGTKSRIIEMHCNEQNKYITENCCNCMERAVGNCGITTLDWSPTGNSFASGCTRGTLISYTRNCQIMHWYRVSRNAILMVRISPDARYVAATAVRTEKVFVMSWPSLKQLSNVNSNFININTIAWHPWRSALLGVGAESEDLEPYIILCDAATLKIKTISIGRDQQSIDTMLFSHRTGELVLSLWNYTETTYSPTSRLVVMSDPQTVVDQWGEGRVGLDRVRTMMFSPDGTKLATATADEDLIIWNFLPEDNCRKKKTKSRRFSALPVYLDEAVHGVSFR